MSLGVGAAWLNTHMGKRAQLDKKALDVSTMFNEVAPRYDVVNDILSAGQVRVWRRAVTAALDITPGLRLLDLAAGTGTSTAAFAAAGADVVGADFSEGMLSVARREHPGIEFVQADATALPFDDAAFDAVTISYGLRNIEDPQRALEEMMRVVRPGGQLVVAEFSHPVWAPLRGAYHFYLREVLPRIASVAGSDGPAYGYLMESILDWPDQRTLAAKLQEAGWRGVKYRNLTGGIVAVHSARKPNRAE
ncbi:ubiquinone/menaquinone biosynthesis methyltransferase [Actinobaculum massiliense ACS-171-V-Col2]|uniref:Demethylmenaquinone methyltransferase n=2 Tax=Actinobaculum TaxID=76833 RepID=K9EG46_9ACTO|nr:ubiquinone/menaquinone biosynthesis methyltransferase [Actinobaculum massiliense ACS-171-V-Col2]